MEEIGLFHRSQPRWGAINNRKNAALITITQRVSQGTRSFVYYGFVKNCNAQ